MCGIFNAWTPGTLVVGVFLDPSTFIAEFLLLRADHPLADFVIEEDNYAERHGGEPVSDLELRRAKNLIQAWAVAQEGT